MLRTLSRLRTPFSFAPPCSFLDLKNPSISLFSYPFSHSPRRKKGGGGGEDRDEDEGLGVFVLNTDPESPPKLFVVQPRLRPDSLLQSKLSEALNLANSLEEQRDGFYAEDFGSKSAPPHLIVQNPAARSIRAHADTYFGPGTVDNIKCHLKALETESHIDAVFVNAILSGIQQRNLEVVWGKPVLDRVGLIIEIFNAHAETKEAKLQSELAALMYKRSRLVRVRGPGGRLAFGTSGEAEVVSARGRGSGGRGFISGAGETELQLQRRRIQERRNHLLAQIEEVRRTRALQRAGRKRHGGSHGQGLATIAVVGYTNAGKSTLVSVLSNSDLYSDDRLFATVDPRLRSVILPSGRKAILSDTVGFISDLPVQLVEAFHATLEEVVEADLLVHVLDSSAPNLDEQRSAVLQVLEQIGVSEEKIQNMIEVWNKIDLLNKDIGLEETLDHGDFPGEDNEGEGEGEDEDEDGEDDHVNCIGEGEDGEDENLSGGEEYLQGPDEADMASELLSEENTECTDDQEAEPPEELEMPGSEAHCEPKGSHRVETSAVMGIGLQELLYLIDEKLSAQKKIDTRSFGQFDRKWRPSYSSDTEKKAAEQ